MRTAMSDEVIHAVVAVDFGTTYSGFAYAHTDDPATVITHSTWPTTRTGTETGLYKANTILQYANSPDVVVRWGRGAVAKPSRRLDDVRIAELFKLHLSGTQEKPLLPEGITGEKAVKDYLGEMRKLIKATLKTNWPDILFPHNIRFVFTVPAEYDDKQRHKMRYLIYQAGFLESRYSANLEITTEPEAAAVYCLHKSRQYLLEEDDCYLIVDCGGGTVDLTIRKILGDAEKIGEMRIGEITERTGGFCGGSYVDQEFIKCLTRTLGTSAVDQLRANHYQQYQYLIDRFCMRIKIGFTGDEDEFEDGELELDQIAPALGYYVDAATKQMLQENDWLIEFNFRMVKAMFDPVVDQIITLIDSQLANVNSGSVKAIFMVGGFSESKYLQTRVRDKFKSRVGKIVCPAEPVTAIVRGAAFYGLNVSAVKDRVLKYTYGVVCGRVWEKDDPPLRNDDGVIRYFSQLATRGNRVDVNQPFKEMFTPFRADQTAAKFRVLYTKSEKAKYPDEPGMEELGILRIDLPDECYGTDRPIEFTLLFGQHEIKATAINLRTRKEYTTSFKLEF